MKAKSLNDRCSASTRVDLILRCLLCDNTRDDADRCAFALSFVTMLWQLSAGCFSEVPPSMIIVNGELEPDFLDKALLGLICESDPHPESLAERLKPRLSESSPCNGRVLKDYLAVRKLQAARGPEKPGDLEQAQKNFKRLSRGESDPKICSTLSAATHPDLGLVTLPDHHVLLWLTDEVEKERFEKLISEPDPERFFSQTGVDLSGLPVDKNPAFAGAYNARQWPSEMVEQVLHKGLPVLFIPHSTPIPWPPNTLKFLGELRLFFMQAFRPLRFGRTARTPDLEPPLETYVRIIRKRLMLLQVGYDFWIRSSLYELYRICSMVEYFLTKSGQAPLANLKLLLLESVYRGVAYAVESLTYQAEGLGLGDDRKITKQLLAVLRQNGTMTRGALTRRIRKLRGGYRSFLLSKLQELGLISLNCNLVQAVSFHSFIKSIPARRGFPPLLPCRAETNDQWSEVQHCSVRPSGPPGSR